MVCEKYKKRDITKHRRKRGSMFDSAANFETLVEDGQERSGIRLNPLLADFLPRILERVCITGNDLTRPITKEWYESQAYGFSHEQKTCAEQTGDACLVLVSFMPKRAHTMSIKPNHYVRIGMSAYDSIARMTNDPGIGDLYHQMGAMFVPMVNVLQAGAAQNK